MTNFVFVFGPNLFFKPWRCKETTLESFEKEDSETVLQIGFCILKVSNLVRTNQPFNESRGIMETVSQKMGPNSEGPELGLGLRKSELLVQLFIVYVGLEISINFHLQHAFCGEACKPAGWQVQDLPFRHREDGMDTSRMAWKKNHVIHVSPFPFILLDFGKI